MKPRLAISFSGGRSSAVMTRMCFWKYGDTHDIVVTFANTGCEHPGTLNFVRDCDQDFKFGTVWMEAEVTHGERIGIRPKIVTYETASRKGEPFEDYIKKYGIPSKSHPQCTSRLKTDPMEYYLEHVVGWHHSSYQTAIGIRADEMDRVSPSKDAQRLIYPLVDAGIRKEHVKAECAKWAHDLKIPGEHYGNCVWCWKKTKRKLMTHAVNEPAVFDFPFMMEQKYGTLKAENDKGRRNFFRGGTCVQDIFNEASRPFLHFQENMQQTLWDEDLDVGEGCGESCEIRTDERSL